MSLTAQDILMDADLFRAAYPRWPSAETTTPLEAPPLTGRELTDYSDDPRFAIRPASYWVAAASTSGTRSDEAEADGRTAAMEKARTMSAEAAGVSFGVYAVRPGEGAVLVASFFNGERRFTALDELMAREEDRKDY
jgi:hypothetical protein